MVNEAEAVRVPHMILCAKRQGTHLVDQITQELNDAKRLNGGVLPVRWWHEDGKMRQFR